MFSDHVNNVLTILRVLVHDGVRDDRGDIPRWVVITLASAVLVAGLLALALPALEGLFKQAISQVSQGG